MITNNPYGGYYPFNSNPYYTGYGQIGNQQYGPATQVTQNPVSYQQPTPQPASQQPPQTNYLNGKIVENRDMVTVTEIPVGGYGIFPKTDLSEIYVKTWNQSGTTDTLVFKPVAKENAAPTQEDIINKIFEKVNDLELKFNSLFTANTAKIEQQQQTQSIPQQIKGVNISDY